MLKYTWLKTEGEEVYRAYVGNHDVLEIEVEGNYIWGSLIDCYLDDDDEAYNMEISKGETVDDMKRMLEDHHTRMFDCAFEHMQEQSKIGAGNLKRLRTKEHVFSYYENERYTGTLAATISKHPNGWWELECHWQGGPCGNGDFEMCEQILHEAYLKKG